MSRAAAMQPELPAELQVVSETANAQICAAVQGDDVAERAARQAKVAAASRAMEAGFEFDAIAAAETRGRTDARRAMSADLLKRVDRAAQRRSEADREYRDAVRRAAAVGIPHREVGAAAGVSHATVRAIVERSGRALVGDDDTGVDSGTDEG